MSPKVFISYSHESEEHRKKVLELTNRLRSDGIDANIDQYVNGVPDEGWQYWTEKQISESDAVLLICTEVYATRISEPDNQDIQKGVRFEGSLIYQNLYTEYAEKIRFIPVVLTRTDAKYIPPLLSGLKYYEVSSQHSYDALYRRLTSQPDIVRPARVLRREAEFEKPDLKKIKVFLCHSSHDKDEVRKIYTKLTRDGAEPWLDEEDLLPGQNWREVIPKAVRDADAVIVCLSKLSITKAGYFNKEIKYALDALDNQPEGSIYLIPAQLEECIIPERISDFHAVNISIDKGYFKLLRSLNARANQLQLAPSS